MSKKIALESLNDDVVLDYLIHDPSFFIRNAKKFETFQIPHPIKSGTNIYEWQLARLRNRISELESEIESLLGLAKHNYDVSESFLTLQQNLFGAKSMDDMISRLNEWGMAIGSIKVDLFLFDEKWHIQKPNIHCSYALSMKKFDFIRIQRLYKKKVFLGQLTETEWNILYPEKSKSGSIAISTLGTFGDLGLLIFRSPDPNHYYADQGTELIERITDMVLLLIKNWIEKR